MRRRLLDAEPDLTAMISLNDSIAIGVLAELRARGISVPEQMTVVGFDDMPITRDVRLPLPEMGARAMTLALGDRPAGSGPRRNRPWPS